MDADGGKEHMLTEYAAFVREILQKVTETQLPKLPAIAEEICKRVADGGPVRMVGSVHRAILS